MTKKRNTPFFISCKECRVESPRSFYGCFYLGPFKAGQSLTVANALRRTLLSELSGVAITAAYIEGASHEYGTLPGVRESVLDLLLNLKEIVLKSSVPLHKPLLGYLQARGPGVVRACDLKLPSTVQCVDPDQYIATLAYDGILNLKCSISEGQNYAIQTPKRIQQDNGLFKALSNRVPLCVDPVFMPVTKVNYMIESDELHFYPTHTKFSSLNSKLLETHENHVVILEIWTNGSLHPREAMFEALQHLMLLFSNLGKMQLIQSTNTQTLLKSNRTLQKLVNDLIPHQVQNQSSVYFPEN